MLKLYPSFAKYALESSNTTEDLPLPLVAPIGEKLLMSIPLITCRFGNPQWARAGCWCWFSWICCGTCLIASGQFASGDKTRYSAARRGAALCNATKFVEHVSVVHESPHGCMLAFKPISRTLPWCFGPRGVRLAGHERDNSG